jgi:hypothetical protein
MGVYWSMRQLCSTATRCHADPGECVMSDRSKDE